MAFEREWEQKHPQDTEDASLGDDRIRNLKTDIGERLVDLLYGFNTADGSGDEATSGIKKLNLKQQSSDPTVATDQITLYAKNVDGNTEIFAKDEAGNVKQLTTGGKLKCIAGDYAADSIDQDDIQLGKNSYLVGKNNAGDGEIDLIKANASDVPEIKVGAVLSADTAPASDPAIANKKYVDDSQTPRCRMYLNGNQTITDATETIIAFNAETYDDDSIGTVGAAAKITPAVAGYYMVSVGVRFKSDLAAGDTAYVRIYKNTTAVNEYRIELGTIGPQSLHVMDIIVLDSDDYIQAKIYHNNGATRDIDGTSPCTWLTLQRVGG